MNRITITILDRTVYWDIPQDTAVELLQTFVQTLGPAKEDDE